MPLLCYLVSRLRITVPASSIMKVKSGTQGKVLGREPGRWSVLYWVCYYLVPCIKCKENPEKQRRLGCVCGGGVYRIVHGTECMLALASHRPFPGFRGTCCIPWIQTILFFPPLGKPHHFQTVLSVCVPLSQSPVIFPFPDPVPTLRSHSRTLVWTPKGTSKVHVRK